MTGLLLESRMVTTNHSLKRAIEAWQASRPARKAEKISRDDIEFAIRLREQDTSSLSTSYNSLTSNSNYNNPRLV